MLGSAVLETAIGLVFVYLIFSLIASAIAEYISALFDRRGEHLKHILFNLFDNDDPQGRTILNLFINHPTLQALNSTEWKPKFQSAAERLGEQKKELQLAKSKWNAASGAVANANAARKSARKADDCATKVIAAVSSVNTALKTFIPANAAASQELRNFVTTAETVAAAAEAAATVADQAAKAAIAAEEDVKKVRAPHANPIDATVPGPPARDGALDQSTALPKDATPARNPEAPAPEAVPQTLPPTAAPSPPVPAPVPAGGDLQAWAIAVVNRAGKAATTATEAANRAKKAAIAAEKAKNGLDSDLMDLVSVPKYIPDRIFADVLLTVLTADETIDALSQDENGDVQQGDLPDTSATPFWDRFGAALKVVGGVASRLPDNDVKANVTLCITTLEESLRQVGSGAAAATAVLAQLEKGESELRAAIAAVPDDALRSALEREIDSSLRPLHGLGRDILMLQRAAQSIAMMAESSIKTALSAFINQAGEDITVFKKSVCSWFNDVMDHASGWYKRNTQRILMVIALVLCTVNNVDTISLVGHLSTDPQMRVAAGKEAREFLNTSGPAQNTLPPASAADTKSAANPIERALEYKAAADVTTLPLWWTKTEWSNLLYTVKYIESNVDIADAIKFPGKSPAGEKGTTAVYRFSPNYSWLLAKFTGLLISILAVSMGAPFWFDVLNKLVNVRLVGQRPEKSAAETPVAPAAGTA
jgi:hypothetical protein